MRKVTLLVLLLTAWTDANAFWWLLRGAATRGTASTVARGAATAGSTALGGEAGAFAYSRPIYGAARYCVRPVGASACDLHNAVSATQAAQAAVGSRYLVRPTNKLGVFEILDAVGNVVSIVEAIDRLSNPEISQLPQYVPPADGHAVSIHNRTSQRLFILVRGENCAFNEFAVDPNSRSDISCPNSNSYYVEIATWDPQSGQQFKVQQQIAAGGHFDLQLTNNAPSVWQLVPLTYSR